jgi:hypothetical protein
MHQDEKNITITFPGIFSSNCLSFCNLLLFCLLSFVTILGYASKIAPKLSFSYFIHGLNPWLLISHYVTSVHTIK